MTPIRIVIADDHPIVRSGLLGLLASQPDFEVVGEAANGREAVDVVLRTRPDVVLTDLRMPELDGVGAIREMCAQVPTVRILVLTTYDTDEEIFRGLRAGASSYLLKDVDSARLAETIRAVHAGRKEIPPEIAAKLADHVASETLTPRQEEVLRGVAEGKSNLEIAKSLFVSEGTVKAHVKAILQKLGARDRTQAITIAIRRGLVRPL